MKTRIKKVLIGAALFSTIPAVFLVDIFYYIITGCSIINKTLKYITT